MSTRWLPWHLFCLAMIVLLFGAGAWQMSVSLSNVDDQGVATVSIRNFVYAIQWWIFGVFAVWFWWRYLRDQRDAELSDFAEAAKGAPDQQIEDREQPAAQISLDASPESRRMRAQAAQDGEANNHGSSKDRG